LSFALSRFSLPSGSGSERRRCAEILRRAIRATAQGERRGSARVGPSARENSRGARAARYHRPRESVAGRYAVAPRNRRASGSGRSTVKLRWHHWTLGGLLLVALCVVAVLYVVRKGMIDPWVRYQMVQQIEQRTGGRVELGGFRLEFWRLHVDLDNFTLHGLESANEPPLFHADHIAVGLHIVSFWGRKISLEELIVTKPKVYVRYNANGESNVPKPKVSQTSSQPWHDTLFNLAIGRLELDQGSAVFNDRRVPLDVRGQNLAFLMQYEHPANG